MKEHEFTPVIRHILTDYFGIDAEEILQRSDLLQYLNLKTASASRGSKARGSFGNLYAVYVLVEDYINRGFCENDEYHHADGARFTNLLHRQRQLPFGSKLQNHALNHRMNKEFESSFPLSEYVPILRDVQTNEYWINEHLLLASINGQAVNIAKSIIAIIDAYIEVKQAAFHAFIADCERIQTISGQNGDDVRDFLRALLRPAVDARIFEIVSFAILKLYYGDIPIFWGWSRDAVEEAHLTLYKSGRTNANDGGIDFVMQPLGRFFQVTETLDVKKYFLDIDKVQKYPITFVIKTEATTDEIEQKLRQQAAAQYPVKRIVDKYMDSIEEIINIPILLDRLNAALIQGKSADIMGEIVAHSKVEFDIL